MIHTIAQKPITIVMDIGTWLYELSDPDAPRIGGSVAEVDGTLQLTSDGTSLFQSVREPVVMNSEQVPQYSNIRFIDSDGGDFLFVRRN